MSRRVWIQPLERARPFKWFPLSFGLGQAVRNGVERHRVDCSPDLTSFELDVLRHRTARLNAALPGDNAIASAVDRGSRNWGGRSEVIPLTIVFIIFIKKPVERCCIGRVGVDGQGRAQCDNATDVLWQ